MTAAAKAPSVEPGVEVRVVLPREVVEQLRRYAFDGRVPLSVGVHGLVRYALSSAGRDPDGVASELERVRSERAASFSQRGKLGAASLADRRRSRR